MRKIILNAGELTERRRAHRYLKESFGFPDYYGNNLDALHDMLTELADVTVEVRGEVSGYGGSVLRVLRDSAGENPGLTLAETGKKENFS